jgi:hypothetical protein
VENDIPGDQPEVKSRPSESEPEQQLMPAVHRKPFTDWPVERLRSPVRAWSAQDRYG